MNLFGGGSEPEKKAPAKAAEPAAGAAAATESSESKQTVVQMKTGDYMIHVFVMIGKNFKCEGAQTINPLIEVSTCGITKYTASKSDVACGSAANISWREHLFFEPRGVHSSQIELDTISFKVKNKGIFKDELIGMYEFDITKIYFEKGHALQNQWIALFNPESSNFNEISGNLKISISVQGPGDEQVQLSENNGPEDPNQAVMMPAQIKKEFKQLKIRFINGEGLPQMDTFGTIDAFVQTKFMGKALATKPATAKSNVAAIEQEWWLPIQWPLASDRLVMQVLDYDMTGNDMVGSMFFSLKKLLTLGEPEGGHFYWQNMFGAPIGYSNSAAQLMDENPEIGSTWKGRILMHLESADCKHPERREQALEAEIKQKAINMQLFTQKPYDIIAEIGQGICLPTNSTKYTIKIKIGEFEMITESPKEAKPGYNRWSYRFPQSVMKTVYQNIEEMDKVFVYIMDGSYPICYWKGNITEFTNPDPKFRWLHMKNDRSVGKVENEYEAGMIQFKMSINDGTKNPGVDYKKFEAWAKPPPRRLESKKIRCFIFQCRDIPSADSDGGSDAFISLWNPDNKSELKTRVIEDSLNPIYFETLEMLYDMSDIDNCAPIVMNIWDKDDNLIMSDSYDFLGRATVFLTDASTNLKSDSIDNAKANGNMVPKPEWHDIRMGFDENMPASGQVLCSFVVVDDDFDFTTPAKYMNLSDYVPTKEYTMELNVLGLRQLESFGLMPIKKPFIAFRIKSLLPPEKAQAVTDVKTDPNAPGENPNINTTLTFSIQLPTEDLYCPSLSADVFDYVFSGFSQPLIGTMNIKIGEIKAHQENKEMETLMLMDSIIEDLTMKNKQSSSVLKSSVKAKGIENQNSIKRLGSKGDDVVVPRGRRDGYNQMFDQEAQIEEEDNLLDQTKDDQAAHEDHSAGLSALNLNSELMAPLRSAQEEVKRIEGELAAYLQEIVKANRKENKTDLAVKTNLKRRLLENRQRFLEEKKKALKTQKKLDEENMKDPNNLCCDNAFAMVICPQYVLNEELKIYVEENRPPETVFKAVGFNNLEVVKKMMDGDDLDKRSGTLMNTNQSNPVSESARNKLKADKDEENARLCQKRLQISNLHYRRFYDDELENDPDLFHDKVFLSVPIYRGQSRGLKKSWFNFFTAPAVDESGEVTDKKQVGFFKGRVSIQNDEEHAEFSRKKEEKLNIIFNNIRSMYFKTYDQTMPMTLADIVSSNESSSKFTQICIQLGIKNDELLEFIKDETYATIIRQQLLTQTAAAVQVYILEGYDFAQRDIGSFSDPYLIVSMGNEVRNQRDEYQLDQPNPKFNKYFEFKASFPGAAPLVIEAYDFDDLFGDDLIGKTVVDLDDRFFSGDWQALDEKPIEYRQLYHQSTTLSQGVVTCWVEIEPQNKQKKAAEQKIWDIAAEPQLDYEIRVCVMDTKNVPCEDFEGTSDVFMKVYVDDDDKKQTDTHYRCQNGEASFNYRMLFPIKAPREKEEYQLVLQAWDFDLFKSNDYICEWVLDLGELLKNVRLTQQPACLTKKYYDIMLKKKMGDVKLEFMDDDTFWLTTWKDGKAIKVRLDVRIFPGKLALKQKLGEARNDPNMEPNLPPPIGRISFSLNPFAMLAQLVSKEYLNKLYALICVLICCACLVAMAPMLISNLVSQIMFKMFGLA